MTRVIFPLMLESYNAEYTVEYIALGLPVNRQFTCANKVSRNEVAYT